MPCLLVKSSGASPTESASGRPRVAWLQTACWGLCAVLVTPSEPRSVSLLPPPPALSPRLVSPGSELLTLPPSRNHPRIPPIPVFLPRSFAPLPPSGQTGAPGLGWGLAWLRVRIMINPLCGVSNPGWKAGSDVPRGGPHGLSGHAERLEPISAADRWPGRTRGWGPVSGRGGGVQDPGPPPRACPPTHVLRTVVILGLPTSLLL